ncbi:alcohol dehydrogenase AdhP [Polyangium sp. 15x6]|uniref:alcohol dehydrogenase AdhP n=1 Tax=Polyangium sp. 15x6 TaxID=3042687 RepID=UPI0032B5229A
MQRTMRAAVVRAFGQPLSLEEVPVPVPSAGEVLVRVVASGVCHTDLHAANGDWPVKPALPFIPGHEGVGYVAALGAGVKTLKEGDRVGVPWLHSACGACDPCITGWETLCPSQQNTGYSVNGGHAEYVVAPAAYVGRIPDVLGFVDAAPILCAGVTSYKGLKETEARPGQWVVVSGIGGLGHLAIPYAKAMGLRVVAVDVGEDKLDLARELGAEIAVDALHVDPAAEVQKQIGGAHGALVTAVSPGAFRQALGTLRSGGTCVLVGLPPGDFPTPIFDVVLKRLTLRGSIVGTRMDLKEALEIAAHDKIRPTTEVQPLEAINSVFARMAEGTIHGRVVLALREEEKGRVSAPR